MEAHDEADHVAARSTAEAVEEPHFPIHTKGRGLLRMEGAETEERSPSPLQLDPVLSDDLGQVVPPLDLVDSRSTDSHRSSPL